MAETDPDDLARRARRGEPGAYDALVRATSARMYALARRLTGNDADAADVTQEAYLRGYRAIRRFRADASVETWLYRIVANCAASAIRRRRDDTVSVSAAMDVADRAVERDLEAVVEGAAERAHLGAALAALPFALRAVVVLRDVYDLPHDEIAAELRISVGAAKVRLHRARRQLRVALEGPSGQRGATARPPRRHAVGATGEERRRDVV